MGSFKEIVSDRILKMQMFVIDNFVTLQSFHDKKWKDLRNDPNFSYE